ncbi:hypothetical protein [Nocardia farcinica]
MFGQAVNKIVLTAIDTGARAQTPLVEKYGDWLRRAHPAESPEQLLHRARKYYLVAVTASGVAAGMCAAVPGIGLITGFAAMGVDTVFFVEASVFYALTAAALAGEETELIARQATLLSGIVFGAEGARLLGKESAGSAKNWADELADRLPIIGEMDDSALKRLVVRAIAKRSVLAFGRVIPAGIGAVVGAAGNRMLAKSVIRNADKAFGPGEPTSPERDEPERASVPSASRG